MDLTPAWETPHYFTQLDVIGHGRRPQHVHTYGLLSLELAEADLSTGFPDRLVSRLGYEWLISLCEKLQPEEHLRRAELPRFVREEVGIDPPGNPSTKALVGQPPATALPVTLVEAFVQEALAPIREHVDLEIRPLTAELVSAAEDRRQPDPKVIAGSEGHALESARRLREIYARHPAWLELRSTDGRSLGWALRFKNLAERIAMEIFELYETTPELRRCRLCKRAFVPRGRSETFCRSQLWRSGDPIAFELCLPGNPSNVAKAHYADVPLADHQRERKTQHRKWRRELSRAGDDATNPRVIRAKEEYDKWIEQHGRTRGPKRHPEQKADHIAEPQPEKEKNG